jgi:Sap-like sulfolipid-1-addressing protein
MWSTVLVLGLMAALDPLRFGITLLLISRPRVIPNLFAYWVGGLMAGIPAFVIPLAALQFAPWLTRAMSGVAGNPNVRQGQLGVGVIILSVAAALTVVWVRRRSSVPVAAIAPTTTLTLQPNMPAFLTRLIDRARNEADGGAPMWRLLRRAHVAWEDGSSWVALAVGIGNGPPPVEYMFVLTVILASGYDLGGQMIAGVIFVVGMLAIIEGVLLSYLAAPARTQAAILRVHDWVLAHRRQFLVGLCLIAGSSLVASGMGVTT